MSDDSQELGQETYLDLENKYNNPFTIVSHEYHRMGKKTTICLLTCRCGLEVVGTAHCVDPDDYDNTGMEYALKDAESKVLEYQGVLKHTK